MNAKSCGVTVPYELISLPIASITVTKDSPLMMVNLEYGSEVNLALSSVARLLLRELLHLRAGLLSNEITSLVSSHPSSSVVLRVVPQTIH
jgi:hypothetical protein